MKSATNKNCDYFHFGGVEKVKELTKEHPDYKLRICPPDATKYRDTTIEAVQRMCAYYWDNLVVCDHEFKEIRVSSDGLTPGGSDDEYDY